MSAMSDRSSIITFNMRPESDIYEEIRYPAGETQIRLREGVMERINAADEVRIIARVGSAQDIISLLLLGSALSETTTPVSLILPYLPYSRADRAFRAGDCHGLEAFGKLISTVCNTYDETHTLDAHNSLAAEAYVPGLVNHDALSLVHRAITDHARRHNSSRITVLFPDEGARARYTVPGHLSCNAGTVQIDVLHCTKQRDNVTGKFLSFTVPEINAVQPAIIIDDICDGGGTFLGIAEKLDNIEQHGFPNVSHRLGLYVTHGIFSKGLRELEASFDHIYTTNTLYVIPNGLVTVYDAMPILLRQQ